MHSKDFCKRQNQYHRVSHRGTIQPYIDRSVVSPHANAFHSAGHLNDSKTLADATAHVLAETALPNETSDALHRSILQVLQVLVTRDVFVLEGI